MKKGIESGRTGEEELNDQSSIDKETINFNKRMEQILNGL